MSHIYPSVKIITVLVDYIKNATSLIYNIQVAASEVGLGINHTKTEFVSINKDWCYERS